MCVVGEGGWVGGGWGGVGVGGVVVGGSTGGVRMWGRLAGVGWVGGGGGSTTSRLGDCMHLLCPSAVREKAQS